MALGIRLQRALGIRQARWLWRKWRPPLLSALLGVVLLLGLPLRVVLVVGVSLGGARRWK